MEAPKRRWMVSEMGDGSTHPHYSGNEDFIRYALDSAAIVAITDIKGTITFVNHKFCEISGYTQEELIGANHRILNSGIHRTEFFRQMYRQIAHGLNWHGEICNRRKDGTLYWVDTTIVPHITETGKVDSYTSIRFDVTQRKLIEEDLRAANKQLDTLANIDPLTGIANRRRFGEVVTDLLAEGAGQEAPFYLALMDIDAFKEINDAFGHDVGDLIMQTMSSRLMVQKGENGSLSRLGGDEFGFVVTGMDDNQAVHFFNEILEVIRGPIRFGGTLRRCSASIGIARYPDHGDTLSALFKAADMALYHAKYLGRDRIEFFEAKLKVALDQKAELLGEIEVALRRNELALFYQPVVPLDLTQPPSLEALMRWRHPSRGLLTPEMFQAALEDKSTAAALGRFMLEQVFQDAVKLRNFGIRPGHIAINLTNADFRSDQFLDRFFELSRETGIPPEWFCVEVTEGMFLERSHERLHKGLHCLHDAGVMIAIDDFGTGYASLTHLQKLPLDRIKIDKSFVANIVSAPDDLAIVQGIIEIGHKLGKTIVAEGVETRAQAELLASMKCDFLQGWYFGKAEDPALVEDAFQNIPMMVRELMTGEISQSPVISYAHPNH